MAIGKIKFEKGKVLVEFDADATAVFENVAEVNAHKAREGLIVMDVTKTAQQAGERSVKFTAEQLEVMHKLISVRFESRTPSKMEEVLTKQEKDALEKLVASGMVLLYKGGKYAKTGVYSIPDSIYPLLPRFTQAPQAPLPQPQPETLAPVQPNKVAQPQSDKMPRPSVNSEAHLERYGYMILENEADAKRASNDLSEKIKAGQVKGVRAFDKKFYIATKAFYESHYSDFMEKLGKGNQTEQQLTSMLSLEAGAAKVMLTLLGFEGEVIEKKKGAFAKV